MVSDVIECEDYNKKKKKEFFVRVLSSFMFIPLIFSIFFVSYDVFSVLCWITYLIIVCEIFSPKIKGRLLLRIFASVVCLGGISSFIYCRKFFGPLGCGFLICMASFTDIGAYSFGSVLKGPKLCPKISPNKTWAGFWGGIILANVAFFCLIEVFLNSSKYGSFASIGIINFWVVQAVILASIFGDLLESSFKRKIAVKDMGDMFPGHGGILDRLDSLLLASIVFAIIGILF